MPDENDNSNFDQFNFDPETDTQSRQIPPWVLVLMGFVATVIVACGLLINYTFNRPSAITEPTAIAQNGATPEQSNNSIDITTASSTKEPAGSPSLSNITPVQTEDNTLPTPTLPAVATETAVAIATTVSIKLNTQLPQDSIHNISRYTSAVYDQANLLITIDSLNKRIDTIPSVENFILRGNIYVHLRQYDLAQNDYLEAIKRQSTPNDAQLYTQLGIVTFYLGATEDAHMYFDQALELNDQFYPAYVGRAQVFRVQGNFDLAITDIQAALTRGAEKDSLVHYHLAEIYAHANRYDEFHATMLQVIELQPGQPAYYNGFCWLGSILGHASDVMSYCEQSLSLSGRHHYAYDSRGLARALSGDTAGAIDDFRYFLFYTEQSGEFPILRQQRLEWIKELEAGENPFTPELLASLLYQ